MDLLTEFSESSKIAPRRYRAFAALIDFVIVILAAYAIAYVSGQTYTTENKMGFQLTGLPALLAMLSSFIIIPVNEGITGQTIGKRIFKLKVVKSDFTRAGLGSSIVRHLFDSIDCFFFIGFIVAYNNNYNQRIGDLVAKTYVIIKDESHS